MIITTRTETYYKVEMTAKQREALITGLLVIDEQTRNEITIAQAEAMNDLRLSLLNAS